MSEFKFTCPVCGQHMAVDAGAAGAQIECPTCFQRILVPQAPRADSKYILSATQYIKPQMEPALPPPAQKVRSGRLTSAILITAICAGLLALAFYVLTEKGSSSDAAQSAALPAEPAGHDRNWSLNLDEAVFPGASAAGKVHDREFTCQQAVLQGHALALSQSSGPSELIINVYFPTNGGPVGNSLSLDVRTNHSGTRPRVTLRWREGSLHGSQTFTNGYAMKLELAPATAAKVPGKIYLCLPDDSQSFIAGTFDAEVKQPVSPRPF